MQIPYTKPMENVIKQAGKIAREKASLYRNRASSACTSERVFRSSRTGACKERCGCRKDLTPDR